MSEVLTSKEIGARLRKYRKLRGMTQEQLAESVDVTFQQIQQYENGTSRLNTDKLQAVANALSVPVAAFFVDGDIESALTKEEQTLINGYRSLASPEVRSFVLKCLLPADSE